MFKERKSAKTTIDTITTSPKVYIAPLALMKMKYYVQLSNKEIGWLGEAYKDEQSNYIYIKDVMLFKQEVHMTTCEITPEGLSDFAKELLQLENGMNIWNNLTVWGHSHVNMDVSPSSQDHDQMKVFKDGGHKWFLRIIANKSGELEITLFDYELNLIFTNLSWEVYCPEPEMLKENIEKEIKEKVSAITFTSNYTSNSNYGTWKKGTVWDYKTKSWINKKEESKKVKKKTQLELVTEVQNELSIQNEENNYYSYDEDEIIMYSFDANYKSEIFETIEDALLYFTYDQILAFGETDTFIKFEELVDETQMKDYYQFNALDLYDLYQICKDEINLKEEK